MRFIVIIFLILGFNCEAQNYFNRRYDFFQSWADNAFSLVADSNYIWVITGMFPNGALHPPLSSVLLKLDYNGNVVDTDYYFLPKVNVYPGGPSSLNRVGNGFILGGSYEDSTGNVDAYLIRIATNGDTIWTKAFGDTSYQSGWMAKPSADGGFLLCGETNISSTPYQDNALLIHTDSLGNLLWQRNYGDSLGSELAFSFTETANGGYALSGWRVIYDTTDMWIAIIDSMGTMQWDSIIRNPVRGYDEGAWNIINTTDGNLLVTGYYAWQSQSPQPYYLKLDLNGNVIWNKMYFKAEGAVQVFSTRELPDGTFISAGFHSVPPFPPRKAFLLKLSSTGDSLWLKEYYNGAFSSHQLRDVYPTPDGGFVACGWINPSAPDTGYQDIWIIKVDSMGCEIANCTVGLNELMDQVKPIKVYPVPFSFELNISFLNNFENGLIKIFDATGKLVFEKENDGVSFHLSTSNWNDGIYLVQFLVNNEMYFTKVVKTSF